VPGRVSCGINELVASDIPVPPTEPKEVFTIAKNAIDNIRYSLIRPHPSSWFAMPLSFFNLFSALYLFNTWDKIPRSEDQLRHINNIILSNL
jgi:hypothetical protein